MRTEDYGYETEDWMVHQSSGGYFRVYEEGWIWIKPIGEYEGDETLWQVKSFIGKVEVLKFEMTGSFECAINSIGQLEKVFSMVRELQ